MARETHNSSTLGKELPQELGAPAFVDGWKRRALVIGLVSSVVAALLAVADRSIDHVLRAWLLGLMLTFGFAVGGLALLMVQYVTGGKWGLLLRRPLEAMSRTLPLVFAYWVVVALSLKKLYLWAAVSDVSAALKSGWINEAQAHAIEFKRPMLNANAFILTGLECFAIWGLYTWRLNALGLERDRTSPAATSEWIKRLENISGPGIVVYTITMTAAVIYWVMSLDPTWYSSVYGLLFLVGQGYQVLALGIIIVVSLSQGEPFKTILRQTEQHDLGKSSHGRRRREARLDQRGSTRSDRSCHPLQGTHAQPVCVYLGQPAVLRHLGLLHMAAQFFGTRTRCGFPHFHARVDQAI